MEAEKKNQIYEFGPFRISVAERVLRREGRIVPLTPKCFDTLLVLAGHGGNVVEKETLMRAVWPDSFVEEGNLAQNIFTLRKTLGAAAGGEQYIETIPKRGYRLAIPVANGEPAARAQEGNEAPRPAQRETPGRAAYLVAAAALVALALLLVAWAWLGERTEAQPRIALLTVPNNMIEAAISPDGKQIAYVSHDADGQSLWVRETGAVGTGARLIPAAPGHFWGVSYSPDGGYLYYVFDEEARPAEGALFRVPARGGKSQSLLAPVSAAPSFSPDGRRMVFKRYAPNGHGYLLTATPLGTEVRTIAQSDAVYPFYNYQWASGGKSIYYVERTSDSDSSAWSMWEVPAVGGAAKLLMTPQPRPLRNAIWLNRSEILALIPDEDSGMRQIWHVSLGGRFRQLTNGINDYSSISLTADGRTILASSIETNDSIWTSPAGGKSAAAPSRLPLPAGAYNDPAWCADGRLVFAGPSNLWLSNADGSERKPLLPAKMTVSGPAASPDGRSVFFVLQRGNARNLWRIGVDGAGLRQVTTGQWDWHFAISADGKWVVYESRVPGQRAIWKAPVDGVGARIRLVDNEGAEAGIAIAPGSRQFAYRTDLGGIAIRSLDDGRLLRTITAPSDPADLHWTLDGKAITYVCHTGRSVQLWKQAIDGGGPRPMAETLPNDALEVSWSRDESRIVYLHREIKADLALITNFR